MFSGSLETFCLLLLDDVQNYTVSYTFEVFDDVSKLFYLELYYSFLQHTEKISKTTNDHARVNSPSDRPGLLSQVRTVLTNLECNVANANAWAHNAQQQLGEETGGIINDPERLSMMKQLFQGSLIYREKTITN